MYILENKPLSGNIGYLNILNIAKKDQKKKSCQPPLTNLLID